MKYKLLFLIIFFFSCSKKSSYIYFESKDLLLYKLIPYDFNKLKLEEKIYIYYLSKAVEEFENIRIDQIKYDSKALYDFIFELYKNRNHINANTSDKIKNLYYKFKTFNSLYYNFKKINNDLTYEELKEVCDTLLHKNNYLSCHNNLNLYKLFLFDNNLENILLNKYSYDPLKYSLVNFNSNDLSIFNIKTIKLKESDKYSYFYKSEDGRVLNISFCEKYKFELNKSINFLEAAKNYTSINNQLVLDMLINFYKTCDTDTFSDYNLVWSHEDFSILSGFIEKDFDPINTRGLIAGLIINNNPFNLYHALGFNNIKDSQFIILPIENAMKDFNNNRIINSLNVFNPVNKYLRENILNEYYSEQDKDSLKKISILLRSKIEELKNTYLNNLLFDKKANKEINLKYPYLNQMAAYLFALVFIEENKSFNYLKIENINKLVLIDFFTEALVLESVFNEFNVSISLILNNFLEVLDFFYLENKYYFNINNEKFLRKAKMLLNEIEKLNYQSSLIKIDEFYKTLLTETKLDQNIANNIKNRYFALKRAAKYIKFKNPTYELVNKNNVVTDVVFKH